MTNTVFASGQGEPLPNLNEQTNELRISGILDFDSSDGTLIDLNMGVGYFFVDGREVGLQVNFRDNDPSTQYGFGLFLEQNYLITSDIVPFLGVSWSYLNTNFDFDSGDVNAIVLGLQGGIKYFITPNLALAGQLELELANKEVYAEDEDLDDINWSVTMGLRYFFDLFYFDFDGK